MCVPFRELQVTKIVQMGRYDIINQTYLQVKYWTLYGEQLCALELCQALPFSPSFFYVFFCVGTHKFNFVTRNGCFVRQFEDLCW